MVNKIIDKKIITTEKEMGVYKASFNTSFNEKDSDVINLTIQLSEDLRVLIKESTINEKVKFYFADGQTERTIERYKVKKWVFNTLNSSNREMLFMNDLVDKGKIIIPYYSTEYLERVINNFKENMRILIQTMLKFSKVETTINFNLK